MLSDDKNIELIGQLAKEVRNFVDLQSEYLKSNISLYP